jgi:hypothetical protein
MPEAMTISVTLTGSCTNTDAADAFHRAIAEAAAELTAAGGTITGSVLVNGQSHQIDGQPIDPDE